MAERKSRKTLTSEKEKKRIDVKAPMKTVEEKVTQTPEQTASSPIVKAEVAEEKHAFPIVGIGASAGGLEAFTQLLENLPVDSGMAFVFIQHLAPGQESMLTDILARSSKMPVHKVENDMPAEPNNVYVIPPDVNMTIDRGFLKLQHSEVKIYRPIDTFLISLAKDMKNLAIGVILSGTGADGTEGLKAIYAEGGITFAQDEESAKYPGMPHNAIASDSVLFVLPPQKIAGELVRIGRHPHLNRSKLITVKPEEKEGDGLRSILTMLRLTYDVDFSYYKETTVNRRIARRMVIQKMEHINEYIRYLRNNKTELLALFDDMLIGVTSFFREPETFEVLTNRVFPLLVKDRSDNSPIRIWVPGCSSGEEVYSLAISLREFMEKVKVVIPVQIFGTDVGEKNIEKARAGRYPEAIAADVSPERLSHFFSKTDSVFQVIKPIRDMCIFARQDLTKDPPFSNLDIISCRNVLIYFKPVLQKKLMPMFHYALKPRSYLVLGNSESVGGFDDLFSALDKTPVYMRKMAPARVTFGIESLLEEPKEAAAKKPALEKPLVTMQKAAERLIMSQYAPPNVLVNNDMEILSFRGNTGLFLEPAQGQASLNLMRMVREELRVDVQTAIYKARKDKMTVRHEGLRFKQNGDVKTVSLEVIPLSTSDSEENFFLVVFELAPPSVRPSKISRGKPTIVEESAKDRQISDLKLEIASSKETLQTIIEEQEATNEELRAALEEVQSTNEELQSTNEELETSKEELQSTNEELNTLNEEVANRNRDLSRALNDLNNLFGNINLALVILDTDLRIRLYTPLAEKMLKLTSSDLGRPFGDIRLDMNIPDLDKMLSDVISNLVSKEKEMQDSSGHWFLMRIRPYLTVEKKIDGAVLSFMDIDAIVRGREEIEKARTYSETVMSTMREPLVVLDGDFRVVSANKAFYDTYRENQSEVEGKLVFELGDGAWDLPMLRERLGEVLAEGKVFDGFFVEHDFPGVGRRVLLVNARPMAESGQLNKIVLTFNDITDLKNAEETLRQNEEKYSALFGTTSDGVWIHNLGGSILEVNDAYCRMSGYSRQELVGAPVSMVEAAETPVEIAEHIKKVLEQGGHDRFESRHRRKDGTVFDVDITALYLDQEGGRIAVFARDITERKKAEAAVAESQRKYKDLTETTADFVWEIDASGRYTYCSPQMEKLWGLNPAEMVGKTPFDMMPQSDRERALEYFRSLTAPPKPFSGLETTAYDSQGRLVSIETSGVPFFDIDGNWLGFRGMSRDVTERKKAEEKVQQLHESVQHEKEKLSSLVNNMPDEVWYADTNKKLTLTNPSAVKEFGLNSLGTNDVEKIAASFEVFRADGSPRPVDEAPPLRALKGEIIKNEVEIVKTPASGEIRYRQVNAVPVKDASGIIIGSVSVVRDITEIKKAEEELRKTRDELELRVQERTKELSKASERLQRAHDELETRVQERTKELRQSTWNLQAEITERKKTEEDLNETRNYLENLINYANAPIIVWDTDYKITRFNRAFEKLTGLKASDVLDKPLEVLFPEDSKAHSLEHIHQAVYGTRWETEEIPILRTDGSVRAVLWNSANILGKDGATVVATIAQGEDITERKQAMESLQESQKDLNRAQAVAATGSWRLDVRDSVLRWSDETYRMFGIPKDTPMTYEIFLNSVHPDDREFVDKQWQAALKGEPYDIEHRIIVDGKIKWVREKAELEVNKEGVFLGGFGTVQDVTEKKEMHDKLEEYSEGLEQLVEEKTQQLKEAQRLVTIGETAGMVGHDIRNPLQSIEGAVYLAREELKTLPDNSSEKKELHQILEMIRSQTNYIDHIVADLQDFSRTPLPQLKRTNLHELIIEALSTVDIPENVQIETLIQDDLKAVVVDPVFMKRVFLNLIENAAHAMHKGGKLTIRAYEEDGCTMIHVEDTGVGIAEEDKPKIFTPLFTTKSKGQGFGLAVCKKLVEAHNGEITFNSEIGKGTIFKIKLPQRKEAS